jgi:hypothetical protein
MRTNILIGILSTCAVGIALVGCASAPKAPPNTLSVSVTRYSEEPISEYQTQVLNEATKLSLACRLFRYFYGRWPADLSEIEHKTIGIDYGIFLGRATVTPNSDDSEDITVFDGEDPREAHATPIDFGMPEGDKKKALEPGFKINVGAALSHVRVGAN